MTLSYGDTYLAYDAIEVDFTPTRGVTHTDDDGDDGDLDFDWDVIATVDATELPPSYRRFFDTDEFVKLDATVVRPIEQTYILDGDEYVFKKDRDELKRAQWSLGNAPWTFPHPDGGLVRTADEVRGFWQSPLWSEDHDGTRASLYIPAGDHEARQYVASYDNVSVGFTNKLVEADEEGVDAIQTNMLYDHVASVPEGRCSDEHGCGLDVSVDEHESRLCGHDDLVAVARPLTMTSDMGASHTNMDAHSHRHSETNFESNDSNTTNDNTGTNMTKDCNCGDGNDDGGVSFDVVEQMSVDAVRRRNDDVAETIETKDERIEELEHDVEELTDARETLESVREALDASEDDTIHEEIERLQERLTDAEEKLSEVREDERAKLVDSIVEHTEWDEDDLNATTDDGEYERSMDDLELIADTMDKSGIEPTVANDADGVEDDVDEEMDAATDARGLVDPRQFMS